MCLKYKIGLFDRYAGRHCISLTTINHHQHQDNENIPKSRNFPPIIITVCIFNN